MRGEKYRAEIDGLRALAVSAVIINHLRSQWLPSGHFGVDIFFVMSGFVITQSLYVHHSSSFAELYVGFLARRMRRLAPALLLCVAVTGVAVYLIVPVPRDSLQNGQFALFGLSNLFLYFRHIDYFTPSRDLDVFLHTWSLGVEEQFYVFLPGIFWLSGAAHGGSRLFAVVIATLGALSLIANIAFGLVDPLATFYLMPFRFWELGAGVLLFALNSQSGVRGTLGGSFTAAIALPLLIASLFVQPDKLGLVQCSVVILTTIAIGTIRSNAIVLAIFSNRVVVFVGLISYPLYLWHWSIISLSRWADLNEHGWTVPLQLALILLLSIVTYRYCERPLRHAKILMPSWRAIGVFSVSLVCFAIALGQLGHVKSLFGVRSAAVRLAEWTAQPFVPLAGSGLSFETTCVVDGDVRPLRNNTFDLCTALPQKPNEQMIWALGDSHAGHFQAMLSMLHNKTGIGVHLIETPGVAFPMLPGKLFEPRQRIAETIFQKLKPGDIVLIGRLFLSRSDNDLFEDVFDWSIELVQLAKQLRARNVDIVVVGPPPMFRFNTLLSCWSSQNDGSACLIDRTAAEKRADQAMQVLRSAAAQSDNIFIFDPFETLCPAGAMTCSPVKNGRAIYRDKDHLNSLGAEELAHPFYAFLKANSLIVPGEWK